MFKNSVDLGVELKFETVCESIFVNRIVQEGRLAWVGESEWTSDKRTFLERMHEWDPDEVIATKKEAGLEASVFRFGESLVHLRIWRGEVLLRVGGEEPDALRLEALVRKALPKAEGLHRVGLTFWYWASVRGMATRIRRVLHAPHWEEISANYPAAARVQLDRLIHEGPQAEAGQLLLWFGEPGCGKTYAVRAILQEWRDRFSFHYISDTERFFGNSDYMLSVLLDDYAEKEKLLILEDAGEFLLPDARQQMGQGLSRLLNATDGLIGQGLRSTFLITTNEPVGRLHPAVSRPGRCASQIQFGSFTKEEAQEWLEHHDFESEAAPAGARLADLYAFTRGEHVKKVIQKVGF